MPSFNYLLLLMIFAYGISVTTIPTSNPKPTEKTAVDKIEGKIELAEKDKTNPTVRDETKKTKFATHTTTKLSSFLIRQLEKWERYHAEDGGGRNVFTAETHEGFKCVVSEDDDHCTIQSIEIFKNIFNMWQCELEADGDPVCRCGYGTDEEQPRMWETESLNCLIPSGRPCSYNSEQKSFVGKCEPGFVCDINPEDKISGGHVGFAKICIEAATSLSLFSFLTLILFSTFAIVLT